MVVTFELIVRHGRRNCQIEQGSISLGGEESCAGTWNCERLVQIPGPVRIWV